MNPPETSAVVLVVDDKQNHLSLMAKVLRKDARIRTAQGGREAIRILETESIDVVLCDLRMPDLDGVEVLKACKRLRPRAEFILMTAYASVSTAVDAMRLGAFDYLTKPFQPEDARAVVLRALGRAAASGSGDPGADVEVLPGLMARSSAMQELARMVRRVADSDATALILGETGTGKERIARAIHQLSPRASERFIAVNCAAIPAELLESELFGYARGSFTGAAKDKGGLFEAAHHGSLFLDEIGETRLSIQAKLTRALEERAVRRLGESAERKVDVRLIAATHRDIQGMAASGTFREDLWYRLNVAVIAVPPLRERREDIELLAVHFLREYGSAARRRGTVGFTPAAIDALFAFDWPGNVRQLRAAIERACVVTDNERIDVGDLPHEITGARLPGVGEADLATLTWADAVDKGRADVGRRYLEAVLRKFDGQVAEAAAHAGVERESFYRLMRRFGVVADGRTSEPPGATS